MSRDWTPEESYLIEQMNIKNGLGSWFDQMENTTFHYNGVSRPLHSQEDIARRKEYPLLGRLFQPYDKLYSFLSKIDGGLSLLEKHEKELDIYIQTGHGDPNSTVIKWFKGELDESFYYNEINNEKLMASIQDEVGALLRFDPKQENCFWFALNEDKCISAWYYPDSVYGDQLLMKLEQRAEDGSMGPHCEIIYDESYGTGKLTQKAICRCIEEIYEDAGLREIAKAGSQEVTEQVMSLFGLKKKSLEDKIRNAENTKPKAETSIEKREVSPER